MTDLEWNGKPLKPNDKRVVINLGSNERIYDEEVLEYELNKHGLDGYVDKNNAYKLSDNKDHKNNDVEFNIVKQTLIKGDGATMNDNDKYSEIKEDLRESERRISQDVRDRESRFEKSMEKFSLEAKEREERFMKNIEDIKTIVSEGEKNRKSYTAAMWTLAITTLLGIAAMVITVITSV